MVATPALMAAIVAVAKMLRHHAWSMRKPASAPRRSRDVTDTMTAEPPTIDG